MPGPFSTLNLRFNPFGELPPHLRARAAVVDVEPLVDALSSPGTAVQLVGPCGHGKSTHLLALSDRLPEARHLRLWSDEPVPEAERTPVLLLDEADAVWPWQRLRLLRTANAVAIGVHRSIALELRALGFQVRTVRVDHTDLPQLEQIVTQRIELARLGDGPVPTVSHRRLAALHRRHGPHVRAIEAELYQHFQDLRRTPHAAL